MKRVTSKNNQNGDASEIRKGKIFRRNQLVETKS